MEASGECERPTDGKISSESDKFISPLKKGGILLLAYSVDMRTIRQIHNAVYAPVADLMTYTALPTPTIQQVDPFLFLNHHGPQLYGPGNQGLPFGPHPHRGMETVTFILDGDIMHRDSEGHESVIGPGGVQWMTAGRGLIHAEVSSETFKQKGGNLEILQLWLNLPARLKMTSPRYIGLQKESIPETRLDDGDVILHLVSGEWFGNKGPFESTTGVSLCVATFNPGGELRIDISEEHNIFFYVVRGKFEVNNALAMTHQLVEFTSSGSSLEVTAETDSILLLGHAQPLNEPVVAQGPFVMNTREEIIQAYQDYQQGKFGTWQ